jgi:hypothetical protein
MSLESFEAVNRNRSYRAYIEKDHWKSAEDPIGFDAYTLFLSICEFLVCGTL